MMAAVRAMAHSLPEARAGAHLARDAALALAQRALQDALRRRCEAAASSSRPMSSSDRRAPIGRSCSPIRGSSSARAAKRGTSSRWPATRSQAPDVSCTCPRRGHAPKRERDNRLQVVGLAAVVVFFAAGLAALIVGIIGWVKHRVDARLLRIVFAVTFVIAVLSAINGWPSVAMQLSTTEPLASQLTTKILGGIAAALLGALAGRVCARASAHSAHG